MKNKPNFHYVITVFHTPKDLLDKCIHSIVDSLHFAKENNTEELVTIVDDCSKEEYSKDIFETIVKKYKIGYIKLEKNAGGLFWTRCMAIKKLNLNPKSYVCFIDSDDAITEDYHQEFLNAYEKYGDSPEIYQGKFLEIKSIGTRICSFSLDKKDILNTRWSLNGRFYKVFLFDNAMKHEELKRFYGEDMLHHFFMYPLIKTMVNFEGSYLYIIRKKTEEEGTEYRADNEKERLMKLDLEDAIKKACKYVGIEDPRDRILPDSKVILIVRTMEKDEPKEFEDRLIKEIECAKYLFSDYKIRVNIRSLVPDKLYNFDRVLADRYEKMVNIPKANRGLAKYYTSFGCELLVFFDGEFMTRDQYIKRFLDGDRI